MVPVELDIAISQGDLGLEKCGIVKKNTSQMNTRETKKKPGRMVGTFIKGKLCQVDLDSIEARELKEKNADKQ